MTIEILMPALSPTMTEGNLAKWMKREGEAVQAGDVVAEIETDKATMEVEAVDEGVLGKILVQEGTEGVAVNQVIAVLLEEGEDQSVLADYKPPAPEQQKENESEPSSNKPAAKQASVPQPPKQPDIKPAPKAPPVVQYTPVASDGRLKASPVAKRLAESNGIDLAMVAGNGPGGRIIKADVEEAIRRGLGASRVRRHHLEYQAIANDNMRKVIARRLLESKQQVPHFYLSADCTIDKLLEVRKDLNEAAPVSAEGKPAYKLSVNDLIIKATALALKKVPHANATWSDEAVLLYNNIDVSVAVAIDGGLITPIIHNADQKDLPTISNQMKDLAGRAKQGALLPEEFQGGGFSISNLGMYGVKQFNAIINPPQGCIMAIGAGEKRPVVIDDQLAIATVMTVTLSCDHRVVDGAVGAQFLAAFKTFIEKPVMMFT